ncbi:putative gibberellin 20 oxidase [Xylariomycetidae sp. FL0641]|nr:putative gibberellin 20 oxidase [Xylariomycetidae sp. FL0641]
MPVTQGGMEIPVIGISGYIKGDHVEIPQIARELDAACRHSGFFQVVGHATSADMRSRLFDGMSQFFALPLATKSKLSRSLSENGARGYEASGTQTLEDGYRDMKEGFMIGPELPLGRFLQGPNLWPDEDVCPGLRDTLEEYFAATRELSLKLFRLLALGLGLEEKYFDAFVDSRDSASMCRIHKYPRTTPDTANTSRGVGAHTDFGAMSLLLQDDIGGLEVFHRASSTWQPVPYVKDAYIVNIGDMMEQWTNGRYMSTLHRVISPASDRDRYSVVFFNEGLLDQVIECIPTCLEPGEKPKYEPVTAEAHLQKRYGHSYGEAGNR